MKSKEYWNVKDAKMHSLRQSLVLFIIYAAIGSTLIYASSGNLLVLFVVVGGGIWSVHGSISTIQRITSYPLCRLTDEFIALNHDRKIISWERVNRVIWRIRENKTTIFYRIRPKTKYTVLSMMHERLATVDRKWMKDANAFHEDLKTLCEERSIPFFEVERGYVS